MIQTVCTISILRMWNNRTELLLAFVVPILFFSIFALIFSRGVGQSVSRVRVSFVDDDRTADSQALINAACQHTEIEPVTGVGHSTEQWPIDVLSRWLIQRRNAEVVVHIPAGFTTQDPDAPSLSIGLHNEGLNPIGHRLVQASLAEAIAMQLAELNLDLAQQADAPLPPAPTATASTPFRVASSITHPADPPFSPGLAAPPRRTAATQSPSAAAQPEPQPQAQPAVFRSIDAFADNKSQPKVAMYAAGIAVMFLLFSANGAGASLLEEREAGTLGRLLSSRLTVTQLLLGKWCFIAGLGMLQLIVMFAWGELIFQVPLRAHGLGFAAMASATSAACASFALFLAALCRSRQQLHGISIVLVLSMSAVGGSMVPRYVMSEAMRSLGKFTFNGWALDGFQKIFWYDMPLSGIRVELCVLWAIAAILGCSARLLAYRWSAV